MGKTFKVKLTKIKSNHKNLRTDTVEGFSNSLPTVGEPFNMWGEGLEFGTRWITTTPVITINKCGFDTANSSYHIDIEEIKETEEQK